MRLKVKKKGSENIYKYYTITSFKLESRNLVLVQLLGSTISYLGTEHDTGEDRVSKGTVI